MRFVIVLLLLVAFTATNKALAGSGCDNVDNNYNCWKKNVYSCTDPQSADCSTESFCGIDYDTDFRAATQILIYVQDRSKDDNPGCPGNFYSVNTLGVVTEALYMYGGDTPCFFSRNSASADVTSSSLTIGGQTYTNFTVFGTYGNYYCSNSHVFYFRCDVGQPLFQVGVVGTSGGDLRNNGNHLCQIRGTSRAPVRRGSALIEDVFVETLLTRPKAAAFCANWGGALIQASQSAVDTIVGLLPSTNWNFHTGFNNPTWDYDGSTYNSAIDADKQWGGDTQYRFLNSGNKKLRKVQSLNDRYFVACTRTMADVIMVVPKCYVGLNCRVKATSTLTVQDYHTDPNDITKVRYVITASPSFAVFEFTVGQTVTYFNYPYYTTPSTATTPLSLRGQGFVATLALTQVVSALEKLIFPASITIYRTKTNIINVGKPVDGTVDTVGMSSGTLTGTLSFGPFTADAMEISILPTNVAAVATLSLSVTSTCDCGEPCSCYEATQNMPTINIKDPVTVGATVSNNLLFPNDALTLTISVSETVDADTVVSFASVCSLTFSVSSVTWTAGSSAGSQVVTVTAPGTITTVQSCPITFTVNNLAPQFNAPSDIALTIGPKITVAYASLQASMTQATAYSFNIVLSRVYTGRPVTVTPQCSTATFSPASVTFDPATLTKTLAITGTGSGCSVTLTLTNTGSSDVTPPADRAVTFTNSKTVSVSAPSLLYVNQVGGSGIFLASTFTGSQYIDVAIGWSGPAGVVVFSSTTVRLDVATPNATVTISALSNGTGSITFTATTTYTANFDTGVAPLDLQVRNRVVPISVPAMMPANMSTDPYYSITVTIDITSLPSSGGDTVTAVLDYPTGSFTVTPPMLTWQLSDGTYSTKTFTIVATTPVLSAAAFAFNLTTTSPEFKAGTYPLGLMRTYERSTVSPVSSVTIYGFPVAFTIPIGLSGAPQNGSLVLSTSFSVLDVSGPNNVTFAFNETTRSLSMTTIRTVTGGITFPVSFVLSSLSTAGVPSRFETRINTTLVTIQPYRTIAVSCNATELFYGPNTAISCNFTLAAPPAGGVVLQLSTRANAAVTSTPNAASFVGDSLTFVFTPVWATHTFADGASQTISLAVADTSRQYAPADLTFTFLKRSLKRYTLALQDPSASFYQSVGATNQNPFVACVTASEINTVATINTTIPGVVTNVSSLSFVGTSQRTMCFEIRAPTATTLSFSLPVSASAQYTPITDTLTVSVRSLETVSITSNATLLFVRQGVDVTVTTSGSAPSAGSLSISTSVKCGGVPNGAALQPLTPTVVDMTSATTTTITYKATAQCSPAVVEVSVSGTSTAFNVSIVPSATFNVRPLKTVSAAVSKTELYGGGVDRLDLWAAVSGLPEAVGASLTLSIADTSSPSAMTLALTSLVFTSGSANRSTFATAAQVSATVATSLRITFSDSAIAEYDLPPSLIFPINIRPIVNVTFSLSFSPAVVYVSPNLKGNMTVTLPTAPSMGTVTVTPLFLAGSPTAVRFSPLSITLGAGQTSGTFSIEALAATSSNEALSLAYTGNAIGYFPQPAARSVPVRFQALGVVRFLNTVPKSVFATQEFALDIEISYAPPASYGPVKVYISSSSPSLLPSTNTITWNPGDTVLQTTFRVTATAQQKGVVLTFTLAAPPIYETTLNIPSAVVDVASARDILVSIASFVYIGQTISGTVEIGLPPPPGTRLALVITPSNAQAVSVSSLFDFTSSSAKTQQFTVEALQPVGNITLTISIVDGSANYDAPQPLVVDVRALDPITATGLAAGMYVGTTSVVTFQLQRSPQCAGSISVVPSFGSGDAAFAPAAGVTFLSGATALSKSVVLTASQTSVGNVPVTLPVSGPCKSIFAAVSAATSTVRIYPRESVTISTLANMTDAADGSLFTYIGSAIPIIVDLGTPALRHTGVRVQLSFAGASGAISFSNSTVEFPPGVNRTIVYITGLVDSTPADLSATVVVGTSIFIPTGAVKLKVLLRIPLTLTFDPSTQLLVVGNIVTLTITIGSAALVGTLQVRLDYQIAGGLNCTIAEFKAGATELTATVDVYGILPAGPANLNVTLFGPAGAFYYATVPQFVTTVRPRRYVVIDNLPSEMFITAANRRTIQLRLQSMPTLSTDVITISHVSSTSVVASPSTVSLSAGSPTVTVTLEGLGVGNFLATKIFLVRSQSNEYAPTVNATVTPVPVQALLGVTLAGYLTSMYVNDNQTFVVTLPRLPMAPLTITLTLPGSSYPLGISPTTLTFSPSGSKTQSLTIFATANVMPSTTLRISTSGSTEFSAVGIESTLQVNPDNEVAVSGWKAGVYIGSTNAIMFSVAIARRPVGGNNLTLTFTVSSEFELSQSVFVFGSSSPLVMTATLRGLSASSGELVLPIVMDDPTAFFVQPVPLRVTILPLEVYGGSISGTLVYEQETITVELTLPKVPTGPMGVSLTVEKNRTSNSLVAVDESLYTVTPGRDQSISDGAVKATFVIKPLTSPLTVRIGFTTSGDSTSEFFILSIPSFIVRFAPLYPMYFLGPANLYRGLSTTFSVTLPIAPPTGAIAITPDTSSTGTDAGGLAGIQLTPASVQFEASVATTLNFTAVANVIGVFTLPISVAIMGVIGFEKAPRPASWAVTVEEPYPLDLVDPPAFVYVLEQNKISLAVNFGTLGPSETITVTLQSNASDYLNIFPTSLEVSTSSPVFQVYAYETVWVAFTVSFTSSARRVVLSPRMAGTGLVVNFRPLKKITVVGPAPVTAATIGEETSVSITVSEKPSPGSALLAELQYGGSPSNIVLPPPTQWDSSATVLSRLLTFSGRSPTNLQPISVRLYNDPQYEAVSFSFNFQFEALLQISIEMPLIVFINNSAAVTFTLPEDVSLTIKLIASPLGVLTFSPSNSLNIVLGKTVTGYITPSQERDITISFELSADDAARVAIPDPRTVKVAVGSQVVVNTPSPDIVVYIKPSIYVQTFVNIGRAPTNGTLKVTPQLICPAGNIVTFTPSVVWFNASESPAVLSKVIELRGVTPSSPCSLLYAVDGAGYTSSPQRFTVETRNLHTISLASPPARVFLGAANRVQLNVTLDPTVTMPLSDSISVTFASDSPCLTVSPNALFWAPGNQEDHSKIAYVTATCVGSGLVIRTSASHSNIFVNQLPATVTLTALPLQTVSVVDSTSGSTDYFMFVGGAALDLDVTIPEALGPDESMTVEPLYSGIQGSINVAPAVWAPSPLTPLTKKLLIQAVSVSPQAAIKFIVTGPPRFQAEASGDGRLEVFGPKRVTATVPGVLVVGQQVLVRVTIEELPFPGETITVAPRWEGANNSLSWTPQNISWTSTTVGREQFIQLTAVKQSGNFNIRLDVSGSYRFVTSAYSGELSISVPQTISTTQMPYELIKGVRYSIGVNVGIIPSVGTQLFVRLEPELNDLGLECIALDRTEVEFNGDDPLAPVEQLVGVSVIRACSPRIMTFTVLGAVDEYSRVVADRNFVTLEPTPFAIDWPTAMYAGSAPQVAVLTLRETIFDQLNYVNITISTNGSALVQRELHWGYGSRSEIAIEVSNNATEIASFNFTITSNFIGGSTIPDHLTNFLPLIQVRQTTDVPPQLFEGDANKIQVFFDVSSLPTQLGNERSASFELVPESTGPEVRIQPERLQWSADSPVEQFIYIVGVSPSAAPVTIVFRVEGEGKDLVGSWPGSVSVSVSPLLLIDFTIPPKELYVNKENKQLINVTIPDNSSVSLYLSVGGETSAFILTPTVLNFAAGGQRWQQFSIQGVYPTSRVSYMQYTIVSAPTRIAMRVMDASESMAVVALKPVSQAPSDFEFKVVEQELVTVVITPAVAGLRCITSSNQFSVTIIGASEVRVTPLSSGSTVITCTIPDPTYSAPEPFSIIATPKKRVYYPVLTATYIVVPGEVEAQRQFAITLSELPSRGKLVVEPLFDPVYLRFPLVQLQFGQYTAKTQYFFIKGVALTNATNITLRFSGSVSEYNLDNLAPSSCEVIDNLDVSHQLLSSLARPGGGRNGYIKQTNALRVQFDIPRQTIFGSISVVPANNDVTYCSSINPCIPINLGNPILIGTQIRVTAYIFSNSVVNNVTAAFTLSGGVDFNGPSSITIPNLYFLPLEKIMIDTSRTRSTLYFGGQNAQTIPVLITAAPLAGQSVELIVQSSTTLALSSPLMSWSATSTGAMLDPLSQELTVTAIGVGASQNVSFQWRDRTSITSAGNFEDDFANSVVTFNVVPLIVFGVTVEGIALARGSRDAPFTVYLGEVNALVVTITLPAMPVLTSTIVKVSITISNPDVFETSTTLLQFANIDPLRSSSRTVRIYANSVYSKGVNNSVSLRISGPPEYQQDVVYGFSVLAQPLLQLKTSLVTDTIAVGSENAIRFEVWPPVPVDLTLGSIVTCGEVSFAATEQLRWETAMDKKIVSVTGTLPTSSTSSCFIRTPILSGAWSSRFVSPPLDVQMWTRARPQILTDVAASTPGTDVRDVGISFTVSLSEGGFWKFNQTASSIEEWIRDGNVQLTSSRDAGTEPKSVMANLNAQMNGEVQVPLIAMSFIATNIMRITIGPQASFYASAREMITLTFTSQATASGVSMEPGKNSFRFEIRGKKESLIDSNVLGSGAASAAIAGGALSMGAATAAGKLQAIMNAFLCPNPDWRDNQNSIDWNEAPIPLSFGSNDDLGTYAAVAFSNSIVMLLCFCLHMVVAVLVYYLRKRKGYSDKSFAAARATVRFPSLLLFPMLFFYQAVVSAAVKVIMYSPVPAFRALGGITFVLIGFGVPGIAYAVVGPASKLAIFVSRDALIAEKLEHRKRSLLAAKSFADANAKGEAAQSNPGSNAGSEDDGDGVADELFSDTSSANGSDSEDVMPVETHSFVVQVFLYLFQFEGEWTHPDKYWVMRFGMFFDEFRGGFKWFLMVDLGITFALGIVDGIEPKTKTECYGRLAVTVVLFLIQFLTVLYWRPYINRFLNGFFIFAYFIQFLAMLLVASALFDNDPQADTVKIAVNLLIFFSALLMLKTILDVARVLNEHFALEAVFGDNDGFSAVRIRTKTSREHDQVANEVETVFQRDIEDQRRQHSGGDGHPNPGNQMPLLHPVELDESEGSASVTSRGKYQNPKLAASTMMQEDDDDDLGDLVVDHGDEDRPTLSRGALAHHANAGEDELSEFFGEDFNEYLELGIQLEEEQRAHSSASSGDRQDDGEFVLDPKAHVRLHRHERR